MTLKNTKRKTAKSKGDFHRIEPWSEVLPSDRGEYLARTTALRELGFREFAIVGAAILDAALTDLIARRLLDDKAAAADFLGTTGNGRAPLGSFGDKIQAAYLLGLVDVETRQSLSDFKEVRNVMAHRVNPPFLEHPTIKEILGRWERAFAVFYASADTKPVTELRARHNLELEFLTLEVALIERRNTIQRLTVLPPIMSKRPK